MKYKILLILLIICSTAIAALPERPSPVISTEKTAEIFHYQGDLKVDVSGGYNEMQHLIFYAKDDSFYRLHISVGKSGGIITKDFQKYFDLKPHDLKIITLDDGTKAYMHPLGFVLMKSSDGRFEIKIDITSPGDNVELVQNEKNKQMLGNKPGASLESLFVPVIKGVYPEVAKNFDRLESENNALIEFHKKLVALAYATTNRVTTNIPISSTPTSKPAASPSATPEVKSASSNIPFVMLIILAAALAGGALYLFRRR